MPKLIFITNSLESGGAERVMSILANEFVKLGYDISIVSKVHKSPFYELDPKIKLIYPPNQIHYKNKIKTLISRLSIYFDIFKIIKSAKPDIVIPFSTTTNGSIIPICKVLGIKVIACEHNNYKLNIEKIPIWIIKRIIYKWADKLTVLTHRDIDFFYGRFMKNVVVMPNPLPLKPLNQSTNFEREKLILAVGNVSRWKHKGFDNMINIYSNIFKKHPEWELQIAGGGDADYLYRLINKYELNGHIKLLGEVKNIQPLMQQSSIFVLPSRWEGLPMVLIEAMSQGMACIAFDCFTGPADIITHNHNGILVEDQNIDKFSTELSFLIENEKIRKTLGQNAIEKSKDFLSSKIVKMWITLITETINK